MSSYCLYVAGSDDLFRSARSSEGTVLERIAQPSESDDPVLVLPVSGGVPFRLSLPFDDPEKIRQVLPQLLADTFARVGPDWPIAWELLREGTSVVAHGFAFPPDLYAEWVKKRSD